MRRGDFWRMVERARIANAQMLLKQGSKRLFSTAKKQKFWQIASNFNYKGLRENPERFVENARRRNVDCDPVKVATLYDEFVGLTVEMNTLRHERNQLSKKGNQNFDVNYRKEKGKELKTALTRVESQLEQIVAEMEREAVKIPNDTHPEVPVGEESESVVLSTFGTKPEFDFEPRDHTELASSLDLVDFQSGAAVAGSRFVYLKNDAVFLELALVQWSLNKLRSKGFTTLLPPDLAQSHVMESCGFQPRSNATQVYSISDSDLCLSGTSEIALAALKMDAVMLTKELPLNVAAFSHCFRTEVGHGGRWLRGLYRLHQFSKVEMFSFCTKKQAEDIMEQFLQLQIEMYSELGIHFKIVDMATEDLGSPAYRKLDVLAWMPGRQDYGEISSLSNCTDFQARRLNIRHHEKKTEKTDFVYTLNGTAIAVPRIMLTLLETHQQQDGSIKIPKVLQPYMGMKDLIKANPN